ncbi:hypothetical protein [Ferdinandcohnia sp. SAFN-114]|uniref:hypothetical protein n=1 Tax=Ferdinandcohnia sp. SAFN-114 TaxID=3387275 RepID=UPI003F8197DA
MKKSNILPYSLLVIMIVSLIGVLITQENMVLVRIWLISLGFLLIVLFLRFPEKAHKDWSKREISDLSSVILGTIIEFLPYGLLD